MGIMLWHGQRRRWLGRSMNGLQGQDQALHMFGWQEASTVFSPAAFSSFSADQFARAGWQRGLESLQCVPSPLNCTFSPDQPAPLQPLSQVFQNADRFKSHSSRDVIRLTDLLFLNEPVWLVDSVFPSPVSWFHYHTVVLIQLWTNSSLFLPQISLSSSLFLPCNQNMNFWGSRYKKEVFWQGRSAS